MTPLVGIDRERGDRKYSLIGRAARVDEVAVLGPGWSSQGQQVEAVELGRVGKSWTLSSLIQTPKV
jgi:hypothetical protein